MTVTEYYNEVNKKTRKNAIVEYLNVTVVKKRKNAIVEYLDKNFDFLKINKEERFSRVPRLSDTRFLKHHECIFSNVTQLKGPKGNGDKQAAKRD